jgi:hypothetical protein
LAHKYDLSVQVAVDRAAGLFRARSPVLIGSFHYFDCELLRIGLPEMEELGAWILLSGKPALARR